MEALADRYRRRLYPWPFFDPLLVTDGSGRGQGPNSPLPEN
jgi:hypothetical protein